MQFKDYYQILGVERGASDDAIKRAYRKLARQYHPDVSEAKDAEARFKEIGEAYEVLKDPEKRAAYDRVGSGMHGGEEFQPPPGWGSGFEYSGGETAADAQAFSEFFESLFGHAQSHPRHARHAAPTDHHARVAISLEQAYTGVDRELVLQQAQADAEGRVRMVQHTLQVHVPKGVREGQRLRLAGQGGAGADGRRGDLYLEIVIDPHPMYRLVGKDVHLSLPVAPWEAALGARIEVPTPGGRVELAVPAGSRNGTRLRLKGRGLPSAEPGDFYVELTLVLPPASSPQAQALYRQMEQELAFNPRAGM